MSEAKLSVTFIQFSPFWGKPAENQAHLNTLLAQTLSSKTDLIVLPEAFSTGFVVSNEDYELAENLRDHGNSFEWLKKKAAQYGCAICGSIIHRTGSGKRANTFFWATPTGGALSLDKRHLFTLGGEKADIQPESHAFRRGNKRVIIQYKGFDISPLICYDLRFPVWCRNPIGKAVDILIFVANWPEHRIEAWNTLLRARAIENQCFVIGVNRTGSEPNGIKYIGNSAVYNPLGTSLLAANNQDKTYSITIEKNNLTEFRNRFPFQQDADEFLLPDQEVEHLIG